MLQKCVLVPVINVKTIIIVYFALLLMVMMFILIVNLVITDEVIENKSQTEQTTKSTATTCSSLHGSKSQSRSDAWLKTVRTKARGSIGDSHVNIPFDVRSDRSYGSSSVVQKICPDFVESMNLSYTSYGSNSASKHSILNVCEIMLAG